MLVAELCKETDHVFKLRELLFVTLGAVASFGVGQTHHFAQVPQCTDPHRDGPACSHYCHVACKNGSGLASLANPPLSSQCAFPDAQITLSISLSSSVDLLRQLPGRAPSPRRQLLMPRWGVYTGTGHLAQKEPHKGDRSSHPDTPSS